MHGYVYADLFLIDTVIFNKEVKFNETTHCPSDSLGNIPIRACLLFMSLILFELWILKNYIYYDECNIRVFFFCNVFIACSFSVILQALGVLSPLVLLKLMFLQELKKFIT